MFPTRRSRDRSAARRHRLLRGELLETRNLLAVTFEFQYVTDNQIGFNDPIQGDRFRTALETAAGRLGSQLLHDATIQMSVFSRAFDGTAVATAASEGSPLLPQGGFVHRVIPGKIVGQGDANGSLADGRLRVFFFDSDDVFTYATDPSQGVRDDEIDFQAVMIHELVHTIGFTSATNADGSDDFGHGIHTPGTWTIFDQFLSDRDGNRLIDGDPQSPTAFRMDTSRNGWPTVSVGGAGPEAGLFFDGPIATKIYGGRVPLYSPASYSLASTGSHLDSEGFPGASIFSPLTHLMSHATVDRDMPQALTLLEKAILADTGLLVEGTAGLEYGDAADPYPVSLADDGARHLLSHLRLGEHWDYELDGQPSTPFDGDGMDDDGVVPISDIVGGVSSATIASVHVEASADARLDAWVDWNQDGDWNDEGEQIFVNQSVSAGLNPLAFNVPADARPGQTAARYRLSSQGNLAPTGEASDGEVEDYLITVLDGSRAPVVSVNVVNARAIVSQTSGLIEVASGPNTLFSAPSSHVGSLHLFGGFGDDIVTVSLAEPIVPRDELLLSGGLGQNRLVIVGNGRAFDLTDPRIDVSRFQHLDLSSSDITTVVLDRAIIDDLSPVSQTITATLTAGDRLQVRDVDDWRMSAPIIVGSSFQLTATNRVGGQVIQANVATPWQNFLRPEDVNNDGDVSAADALRVINELARGTFSDLNTRILNDPLSVGAWPNAYFDSNGDGRVTAVDALRVINALSRSGASGEGENWVATLRDLGDPLVEVRTAEVPIGAGKALKKIRSFEGASAASPIRIAAVDAVLSEWASSDHNHASAHGPDADALRLFL